MVQSSFRYTSEGGIVSPPEIPAPGTPAAPALLTPEQISAVQRGIMLYILCNTITRALGATVVFALSAAAAVQFLAGQDYPLLFLRGKLQMLAVFFYTRIIITSIDMSAKGAVKPPVIKRCLCGQCAGLKMWASLNCANTLLIVFFINTFRNRYFYVGFTPTALHLRPRLKI